LEPFSGAGSGLYASLGLKEFRLCGLENERPETRNLKLVTKKVLGTESVRRLGG
jgi:hypothetical protein